MRRTACGIVLGMILAVQACAPPVAVARPDSTRNDTRDSTRMVDTLGRDTTSVAVRKHSRHNKREMMELTVLTSCAIAMDVLVIELLWGLVHYSDGRG